MAQRTTANLTRIERLIDESARLPYADIETWRQRARLAVAAVYGEGSDSVRNLENVRYSLSIWTDSTPPNAFQEAAFAGVRNTTALLTAVAEDIRESVASATQPTASLQALHPWVAEAVGMLWENGHRHHAVQAAATCIELRARAKLGIHQGSSASLLASAFSAAAASPGQPRLRFSDVGEPESDGWRSAHDGAGAFARGCMLRIRNLYTHNSGASEQEDLEALFSLSLLARWLDDAAVERVIEPS